MNELLLALIEFAKSQSPELWELAAQNAQVQFDWSITFFAVVMLAGSILIFVYAGRNDKLIGILPSVAFLLCAIYLVINLKESNTPPTDAEILLEYIKLLMKG